MLLQHVQHICVQQIVNIIIIFFFFISCPPSPLLQLWSASRVYTYCLYSSPVVIVTKQVSMGQGVISIHIELLVVSPLVYYQMLFFFPLFFPLFKL